MSAKWLCLPCGMSTVQLHLNVGTLFLCTVIVNIRLHKKEQDRLPKVKKFLVYLLEDLVGVQLCVL